MIQKLLNLKQKNSQIIAYNLCLENISKGFSIINMKNTGLFGYICNFSVDYETIAVDYILDIHKYLMKKH